MLNIYVKYAYIYQDIKKLNIPIAYFWKRHCTKLKTWKAKYYVLMQNISKI